MVRFIKTYYSYDFCLILVKIIFYKCYNIPITVKATNIKLTFIFLPQCPYPRTNTSRVFPCKNNDDDALITTEITYLTNFLFYFCSTAPPCKDLLRSRGMFISLDCSWFKDCTESNQICGSVQFLKTTLIKS